MTRQNGRDDARERIKKAASSHGSQTHPVEASRNKKEIADLKKGKQSKK